ncbi:MAG: hypothetical protein LIO75_04420 [Lachnospiraceae bacterium]|nr:hypothetical protein [Lachnospiraceae bacterium]
MSKKRDDRNHGGGSLTAEAAVGGSDAAQAAVGGSGAAQAAVRGSFTVESVFLFPMIVLLIAFMLQLSAGWFEDIQQTAEDVDVLRELDTRTYFLRKDALQGIWDALK